MFASYNGHSETEMRHALALIILCGSCLWHQHAVAADPPGGWSRLCSFPSEPSGPGRGCLLPQAHV